MTKVKCPTCQAAVVWSPDALWRPFCSERCKLIDLGQWADESYRIPTDDNQATDEHSTPGNTPDPYS